MMAPRKDHALIEESAAGTTRTRPRPILVREEEATASLSPSKYTACIKEFFRPKPIVYWNDFLLTNLVGNLFIYLAVELESLSFLQLVCIFLAAVSLYRAFVFVHEEVHVGRQIKGFSLAYNLVFS